MREKNAKWGWVGVTFYVYNDYMQVILMILIYVN